MLVFVAVDAEQFPVAAIQRIVVVVMVLVVHSQLAQAHARKLACASSADPGKQFERALAVSRLALVAVPARFGDDPVEPRLIRIGLFDHVWEQAVGCGTIAGRFGSGRTPRKHRRRGNICTCTNRD